MHVVRPFFPFRHWFTIPPLRRVEAATLPGPETEYHRRLVKHAEALTRASKRHRFLWIFLLASTIAVAGAVASTLWLHTQWSWLLGPAAILGWSLHSLTLSTRHCNKLYAIVRFYEGGLARLHSCWQGQGVAGEEYRPTGHVYATDLDLFGIGSLFEMLCTARTGIGRTTLVNWLLHPASAAEIRRRQEAIIELRNNLELQEQWAAAGKADPSHVTSSTLAKWAAEPEVKFHVAVRVLASILPLLLLGICALHVFGYPGTCWRFAAVTVVALELVLSGLSYRRARSIAANVTLPAFELGVLTPLLDQFQREPFCGPLLNELQAQVSRHVQTAHRAIALLRLWVWFLDLQRNEYFAAVSLLFLWKTNLAILVESWRSRNCRRVVDWLEAVGQFEALLCLARYSFENPDHVFPTIAPDGPAFFHAESLGHPLLAVSECVPCDVLLDCQHLQIMVVSGSNMSGKSTLLRSVGVNAVLAMAGAPVRASRLEMSLLHIGCSIAVQDSLLEGKSRFLAEVERLKQILVAARSNKAIVLLDEVLGGTNSHDRLLGTEAVLGQLLRCGAVAIMTTHDLALTELAKEFKNRTTNAHFEETYENGAMQFDYKLRPGVLTRANGASMLAALGLLSPGHLPS